MRAKRILMPTDLSDASLPALEMAAAFARAFAAELVLLFAVEPIYAGDGFIGLANVASLIESQEKAVRASLNRQALLLGKRGLRVRTLVVTDTAASGIVRAARTLHVDLIVMGTHGRSGLSHLFIGSVAERVVRMAGCPVLTVRAPLKRTTRRKRSSRRPASHLAH